MKTVGSIAALLVLTFAFSACDTNPQQQAPTAMPAEASSQRSSGVWPPAPKQGVAIKVATNLLAKNVVVILDRSGSMDGGACEGGGQKIEVAEKAIRDFEPLVPQDANLGLVEFYGGNIELTVPLGSGAAHRQKFRGRVSTKSASGGTPLASAVARGYEELTLQAQRQLGYGTYDLVVVTDGEADSISALTTVVNRVLADSPVRISTIGFCISDRHTLNQPGRTIYKPAGKYEALKRGLEEVLAEAPAFDIADFKK